MTTYMRVCILRLTFNLRINQQSLEMKKTKEDAELTRELLLQTALKVFNRKGFAETKLEEIAKEAKLTRGAIYWHFENKYNLYYTLIREYTPDVVKQFETILNGEEPPSDRLRKCLKHFCINLEDDEEFQSLVKIVFINTSLPVESEDMIAVLSEKLKSIMNLLSNAIQDGIKAGEFRSNVDPDRTAFLLKCCITGISERWLSKTAEFSPKKNAEVLIDTFLNGIVTK